MDTLSAKLFTAGGAFLALSGVALFSSNPGPLQVFIIAIGVFNTALGTLHWRRSLKTPPGD